MPKSKKRNTKKGNAGQRIYQPAALDLRAASLKEVQDFMKVTEKHIYGDRWGMKHCVIELNSNGTIIGKCAFPYSVDYKEVLLNFIANPQTFALVLLTEGWSSKSIQHSRASLAPDRQEIRSLQYVDLSGRSTLVQRSRADNSTFAGDGVGRTVDYLADALGVVQTIQDAILARSCAFFSMVLTDGMPTFVKAESQVQLRASLGRDDAVEYFAERFKTMARERWEMLGNDPRHEASAIRDLFTEMPFEMPGAMKPFLGELYANDADIPEWLVNGVKKAA